MALYVSSISYETTKNNILQQQNRHSLVLTQSYSYTYLNVINSLSSSHLDCLLSSLFIIIRAIIYYWLEGELFVIIRVWASPLLQKLHQIWIWWKEGKRWALILSSKLYQIKENQDSSFIKSRMTQIFRQICNGHFSTFLMIF